MLAFLILLPLCAAIAILGGFSARGTAVLATGANLLLGLILAALWSHNPDIGSLSLQVLDKPAIHLSLGLFDGMSVTMMLLSVIVAFAAIFSGKCPAGTEKLWYVSCLLIAAGAIGAFLSTDLFFFYAFHELALIPTFLMIGMLGTGDRKEAAWKITIYLAFGSIILLAGLLWLVSASGANSFLFKDLLAADTIPEPAQYGIAALLLVGFGSLVSLFPFHSWAAPAYASAPAPVSMLHAGVLKKFGLFGLFRLYPMVSEGIQSWVPLLVILLLGNILWVGMVTINQKRLDTMLGNSSVMHMGYIFLAFAALAESGGTNDIALPAAVVLMFAHGISIAMLFALSDRIQQATGTLELRELGGLAKAAPRLAFLFGLAAMASIGLPGFANFAGEIMVFLSGFRNWTPAYDLPLGQNFSAVQLGTICALWGLVISAVYMLRAYRQTFQGKPVPATENAKDLSCCQRMPAVLLAVALLVVGLYPNSILKLINQKADPKASVSQTNNQ